MLWPYDSIFIFILHGEYLKLQHFLECYPVVLQSTAHAVEEKELTAMSETNFGKFLIDNSKNLNMGWSFPVFVRFCWPADEKYFSMFVQPGWLFLLGFHKITNAVSKNIC